MSEREYSLHTSLLGIDGDWVRFLSQALLVIISTSSSNCNGSSECIKQDFEPQCSEGSGNVGLHGQSHCVATSNLRNSGKEIVVLTSRNRLNGCETNRLVIVLNRLVIWTTDQRFRERCIDFFYWFLRTITCSFLCCFALLNLTSSCIGEVLAKVKRR